MKSIYRIFVAAATVALTAVSCNDLSDLEQRVDSLDGRVTAIEAQIDGLNDNIEALGAFAEGNRTISSATESDGVWTLTLSDGTVITLNQGSVGNAPVISLDKDNYWMVNGEYIQVEGQKVSASVTPVMGVDAEGYWTVSVNGGAAERVLGADGQPVKATTDNSGSIFSGVKVENGVMTVTMADGTTTYSLKVVEGLTCAIEGVTYGTAVTFVAGQERSYNLTISGAANILTFQPEGWTTIVNENSGSYTLIVTAPTSASTASTKAVIADSQSDVSVLAVTASGIVAMAKMSVELSDTPLPPTATVTLVNGSETPNSLTYQVTLDNATSWYYIHQPSSETAPEGSSAGWQLGDGSQGKDLIIDNLAENTSYTLYVKPLNENASGSIASASGTTTVAPITDYFDAFMAGKDIVIGGVTYNKSQFDETKIKHYLATSSSSIYNNSTTYGDGTIIFIEKGAKVTNLGNCGDIIVIGDNPNDKPIVNKTTYSNLAAPASGTPRLVVANVILDMTAMETGNYGFIPNTSEVSELVFDNCDIIMHDTKYLVGTSADKKLNKFVMTNCNVKITGTDSNRYLFHTGNTATNYPEITITNNIFYSESLVEKFRVLSGNTSGNKTTVDKLTLDNNTFVNLNYNNSAMNVANEFKEVSIQNNLIFFNATCSGGKNFLWAETTYPTTANCKNNIAYDTNSANFNMFYKSELNGTLGDSPTKISENPFEGGQFEISTATFVPNSTYSSYGAHR